MNTTNSILNHNVISQRYFYPRYVTLTNPFYVQSGNNQLSCYYHQINNPKKTIIFFHGNGEVVSDYLNYFDLKIESLGCSILFAEYRGYGLSSGNPSLVEMLDDVEAIIRSINVPLEEIVLFGRSVGSIYALHGASVFPNISGLIIESGISDVIARVLQMLSPEEIGTTEEELLEEGKKHFDHHQKIKAFQGHTLILHTKHDSLVHSSNAIDLYNWANEPKRLKLFEDGDHNDIGLVNEEAYFALLKEFINELSNKTN